FEVENYHTSLTSDAEGSFDAELAYTGSDKGDLTFTVGGSYYQYPYDIKDLPDAISRVAKKTMSTGLEMDHVAISGSQAAILSSNASLLSIHDVDHTWKLRKNPSSVIALNPSVLPNLGPRMSAIFGGYALVPFFG